MRENAWKDVLMKMLCSNSFLIIFLLITVVEKEVHANNLHAANDDDGYFTLGLIGYNYTNRLIEHYSVDGSSGGHIHLSSPTSGGSGSVCCAMISKTQKQKIAVKVRWQVDGCTYSIKSVTGRSGEMRNLHYKEKLVNLDPPTGSDPAYLETHFYPDGNIKVKITESMSSPEIALDRSRRDQTKYSRCKDGEK